MTLQELLRVPYVNGGRDPATGLDCWGLVRAIRLHYLGGEELPELGGIKPGELRKITRARGALPLMHGYEKLHAPEHGAIAAAFNGALCSHVGTVLRLDGSLRVVDTDKDAGGRICPISAFEARFTRVEYYAKKR